VLKAQRCQWQISRDRGLPSFASPPLPPPLVTICRGYWERLDLGDENIRETDPVTIGLSSTLSTLTHFHSPGSVISFEIPLDGYTNISSTADSGPIRGFSIIGDKTSHQYRLQHSLWNSIRIHPSFAFLPLLAPPGEGIPDPESEEPPQQTVERVADLEEVQLNSSTSTMSPPQIELSDDTYTVRSGD
jgi:hypothetical protein